VSVEYKHTTYFKRNRLSIMLVKKLTFKHQHFGVFRWHTLKRCYNAVRHCSLLEKFVDREFRVANEILLSGIQQSNVKYLYWLIGSPIGWQRAEAFLLYGKKIVSVATWSYFFYPNTNSYGGQPTSCATGCCRCPFCSCIVYQTDPTPGPKLRYQGVLVRPR